MDDNKVILIQLLSINIIMIKNKFPKKTVIISTGNFIIKLLVEYKRD